MSGCNNPILKIKYLFSKGFYFFSSPFSSPLSQDIMQTEAVTWEDNSADVSLRTQFMKFLCLGKVIF